MNSNNNNNKVKVNYNDQAIDDKDFDNPDHGFLL